MENQMEKNMENDMETAIFRVMQGIIGGIDPFWGLGHSPCQYQLPQGVMVVIIAP